MGQGVGGGWWGWEHLTGGCEEYLRPIVDSQGIYNRRVG